MGMQEFYIRKESETEARGPFNLEQMASLAESGQLTPDTYYYDGGTEKWLLLSANEELKASLFPEKKKLKMKQFPTASRSLTPSAGETVPEITVDQMLAAAQGLTSETKDKADPRIAMARASKIGMWGCVLMLAVSAAGEMLPAVDILNAFAWEKLLDHPLLALGALDLLLAVLLGLGMTDFYPFIRFRAALGAGFVGFIFFAQGAGLPILYLSVGSAGLFVCTVSLNTAVVALASLAGLAGMGGATYRLLS